MLFVQRLKWAASALVLGVLFLGALYWKSLDVTVIATNALGGTVVYVGPPIGKFKAAISEANVEVDVRLDDARVAHLLAPRDKAPRIGQHVSIADQVHGSGRHTFTWR